MMFGSWLLLAVLQAGVPTVNGQSPIDCTLVHKDAAVNTQVVLTVPAPSVQAQVIEICAIDFTISADNTGTSTQSNVQWTSSNFGGWVYTYSFVGTANTFVDKGIYPQYPIRATAVGQPVQILSPAASAHNAYSINVYYRYR